MTTDKMIIYRNKINDLQYVLYFTPFVIAGTEEPVILAFEVDFPNRVFYVPTKLDRGAFENIFIKSNFVPEVSFRVPDERTIILN